MRVSFLSCCPRCSMVCLMASLFPHIGGGSGVSDDDIIMGSVLPNVCDIM